MLREAAVRAIVEIADEYDIKIRVLQANRLAIFNKENELSASLAWEVSPAKLFSPQARRNFLRDLKSQNFKALENGADQISYIFTDSTLQEKKKPPRSGRRPHPVDTDEQKVVKTVEGVPIERGIPIPPKVWGKTAAVLGALEIGDSYETKSRKANALSGYERNVAKKLGIKITTRKVKDFIFRVWRVE